MRILTQEEWEEQENALASLQDAFENGMALDSATQLLLLESQYDQALGLFVS